MLEIDSGDAPDNDELLRAVVAGMFPAEPASPDRVAKVLRNAQIPISRPPGHRHIVTTAVRRWIAISAPPIALAVCVAAGFAMLTPLSEAKVLVSVSLSGTLAMGLAGLWYREAAPRSRRPVAETATSVEDALFLTALDEARNAEYGRAEEKVRLLEAYGHLRGRYLLAVLTALAESRECQVEASAHFRDLCGWEPVAARSSLAVALLDAIGDDDVQLLKHRLAATVRRDAAIWRERHAQAIAQQTLDALAGRRVLTGNPVLDDALRAVAAAAESKSLHSCTAELRAILGFALCLEPVEMDEVTFLVSSVAGPRKRKLTRAGWSMVRDDVPVLRANLTAHLPYRSRVVERGAAFLASRGLGGNRAGMVGLALTVLVAAAVAGGAWRAALLFMAGVLIIEVFDGAVAKLSSKRVDNALFLDYVLDRLGDVALGVGFFAFFAQEGPTSLLILPMLFVATSLLVSHVRAEADRFRLEGSGGVFERGHRLAVLAMGIAAHRPGYALAASAALTTVTLVQRISRAMQSPSRGSEVDRTRYRLEPATINEEEAGPNLRAL